MPTKRESDEQGGSKRRALTAISPSAPHEAAGRKEAVPPPNPPNWSENSAVYATLVPSQPLDDPPDAEERGHSIQSLLRWAKSEQATYAHGDDRPLGAYLSLMGVYSILVALLAALVRISGRPLPRSWQARDLVLLSVATHKIARLISKDPITSPLRAPMTRFEGTSGDAELSEQVRGDGVRHAVGELLTCPLCLDQWVATILIFGAIVSPKTTRLIASLFGVVAAADVAHHLYSRLQE